MIPYSPVKQCFPCSVGLFIRRDYEISNIPILISFWPSGDDIEVLEHWILDTTTGTYTQSFLVNDVWSYFVGQPTNFTHFWKIRGCRTIQIGKSNNDSFIWLSFDVAANV